MERETMDLKVVGTTRAIDTVGRVVIPKKIRNTFNLDVGDDVEFFTTDKGILIVKLNDEEQDKNDNC